MTDIYVCVWFFILFNVVHRNHHSGFMWIHSLLKHGNGKSHLKVQIEVQRILRGPDAFHVPPVLRFSP